MEYALGVWYSPIYQGENRQAGSVGIANRIAKPQCLAARVAVGGLRSTSTASLNLHANLLPAPLRLNLSAFKFTARLCTLPSSHPLFPIVKRCKKCIPRFHHSPIHNLFAAFPSLRRPIETISTKKLPPLPTGISFQIAPSKEAAVESERQIDPGTTKVFSDGSGYKHNIGAAAWSRQRTAPNGELVGIILAIDVIRSSTLHMPRACILLDNQAAIRATEGDSATSGRYLIEEIRRKLRTL
ncbi:hypothetical protein BT96DRAFT_845121, partial [Gymnopus androsaceus JB14]